MLRLCTHPPSRSSVGATIKAYACYSSKASTEAKTDHKSLTQDQKPEQQSEPKRKKTLAELDEEMRSAMDGLAGDGGLAGAELEGGKAVSMKRGVRDNMFRYI